MYRVEYRPEVHDDLDAVPSNVEKRIHRAIEQRLTNHPEQYGERLRRSPLGLWKIRVGDYRVVYAVDAPSQTVTVWLVGHRQAVYLEAERRWARRPRP